MTVYKLAPLLLLAALVPFADGLFATPQEPARKARKVAFLVGVGKYDHKFSDLGTVPINDVTELARTLGEGGFEVVTLAGKDATKANVEGRFKELLKGGNGKPAVRDGDTVLVVLCGHGIQDNDQPFFCPV